MKPLIKKFLGVGIVILVIATFLAGKATAIGNPVKISNSSYDTVYPQTVADSNGYLHLIWMEVTSDWGGYANPGILYSRWNGDTWSAPLKISENTGFAEIPSIAVDTTNTVHATWDDETYGTGGLTRVAYKTRSSTGTWSSIETLPVASGTGYNWNARVAIGSSNVPNVVYSGIEEDVNGSALYWTRKISGSWTTPELVSKDTSGNNLSTCQWSDLKGDTSGNIHLVYWCSALGPFSGGIFYSKYNGTSWSTPIAISTAYDVDYNRLAITPGGEVFVTWYQNADDTVHVRWTVGGVWQTETTLASNVAISYFGFPIMGITTDSKERAHVGWGEIDGGNLIDVKYRSYVSGTWQTAQDVDLDNNDADSPFVYPDKWDNQHFAWTEKNPSTGQWEIYYRVAEGTIQTVGTGGGSITANPNNITYVDLTIPSGALSSSTQIGIQIGPVPENVDPTQVTIPRAFTFRPHGLVFNSPASSIVYYTDAEVAGADERQLKPWYWNSGTNSWEARDGTVNRSQNKITVSLSGFSLYGMSLPIVNINWLRPSTNEVISQGAYLFEFKMNYADGTITLPPDSPDDLRVDVVDANGSLVKQYFFESSGITKDSANDIYKKALQFQKDEIPNGNYSLKAYLAGNLVGSQNFTLAR